jgi:hypothetical protein
VIDSALTRLIKEEQRKRDCSILAIGDAVGAYRGQVNHVLYGRILSFNRKVCDGLAAWIGCPVKTVLEANGEHRQLAKKLRGIGQTRDGGIRLADLSGLSFPLPTMAGWMVREPLVTGACHGCKALEECRAAVAAGNLALCERPLERDMLPRAYLLAARREMAEAEGGRKVEAA